MKWTCWGPGLLGDGKTRQEATGKVQISKIGSVSGAESVD